MPYFVAQPVSWGYRLTSSEFLRSQRIGCRFSYPNSSTLQGLHRQRTLFWSCAEFADFLVSFYFYTLFITDFKTQDLKISRSKLMF